MTVERFKFTRHTSVGAAAAEMDTAFLEQCFLDTGDLSTLLNCGDPRRIVLGRTGSGKSALVLKVAEQPDSVLINPESLSFNYITNSSILQFFLEAGVKLDLFFRLLWRHVFTVELIKQRYHITNDASRRSFLDGFKSLLGMNKKKEKAVDYLLQWGDKFWESTEYRIKEITDTIEKSLSGSIEGQIPQVAIKAGAARNLTAETKTDVVQRGQAVINSIQMKELTNILEFLNEDVFHDPQHRFFLVIDRLDENWVDDRFRYLLVRSLIETVQDFLQVRNVKIVVALRSDLMERVFRFTRDAGFQEEKYRSLFLPLRWSRPQLESLLDVRVNYLVSQTYTKKPVGYADLLPATVEGRSAIDYMLDRTLERPRELIEFFNESMAHAEGKAAISKTTLLTAEGEYSRKRLRSLQDEFFVDFPGLVDFTALLRKQKSRFAVRDLDRDAVAEFCLNYVIRSEERTDGLSIAARQVVDTMLSIDSFLALAMNVFYRTGLVGLKTAASTRTDWSFIGPDTIAAENIDSDTKVAVHPTFWRALGVDGRVT